MVKLLLGILIGLALGATSAGAFRMSQPPTFTKDWTDAQISQLNTVLNDLFQLVSGRYTLDATTTNPNGNRRGDPNDLIIYNNGGDRKLCVNTSSSAGGTTWRCSPSVYTAP